MHRIPTLIVLAAILMIIGCGYNFTASAPITLPQGVTNIYIQSVENPTLENWIDSYLRSRFQDEFTRRAKINWVGPDEAEAFINLIIISYSVDTELSGAQDQTLREEAKVVIKAEFRRQMDGTLLWSSANVKSSETFEAGTSEIVAGERAVEDAIRKIADKLGEDY
jgi:outer membrane lipopolysaccharide assembly protein LptE/RlpB